MILVTGVTGGLGGLILNGLKGIDDIEVVPGTRKGDGSAARRIDFDDPASLAEGFAGVDVLVFISAGYAEDDIVLARHGAVADAARAAGVKHVIYTSLASSGERMTIALPHRWTEDRLANGPFEVTILRNGLYTEIPLGLALTGAAMAAETGIFAAPFGDGRVSVVAKEDLADIAVRVAVETDRDLAAGNQSRHAGRTYELEGPTPIGGNEIAEVLTESLGRPVTYQSISLSDLRQGLEGSGMLPYQITHTLSIFSNVKAGWTEARHSDLEALLPNVPRPVHDSIVAAVKAGGFESQSLSSSGES
ncbi:MULTISPECIES: NmrA family NAD(P)-binding protein [Glycomyces]|uniref:NAD(P)H dehydrogenase (Quinone) n=2 Tax=Glycomyces TaxID=58113 RepID=A0A9X3SUM6_9ACTN|nr:NmrA family NAD(P)-binding protein [Glycomyces lechevalierae]MDA1385710.1 NmrA family NAD(P)-binding protein [Glycomyces lechevalierae]MDR7339829.1 NAD(P)H dehydrogenase (quinone) [Glycomyces lechevalierae]